MAKSKKSSQTSQSSTSITKKQMLGLSYTLLMMNIGNSLAKETKEKELHVSVSGKGNTIRIEDCKIDGMKIPNIERTYQEPTNFELTKDGFKEEKVDRPKATKSQDNQQKLFKAEKIGNKEQNRDTKQKQQDQQPTRSFR